jgi:ADP-heptose:LPS heptosyltransferase/ubiquinone/menaquinone biosynthesis C-methylase UbiE/glycosyltransferase involved in cell wall biosynthesis/predicted O-methyltransferase YrrM
MEGFVNIDRQNADMNIDVRKGMPFDTNSVDFIYCSHFIEHLSHEEAWCFLDESFRVLKRGGKIRLSTPDLRIFAAKYLARDIQFWDSRRWPGKTSADQFNYVLREMGHSYVYDFESLQSLLKSVGFARIQQVPFEASLDNRPDVSIFAEAEKFPADQNPNTPDYMDVMWAGKKFGVISEQPERIKLYKQVASMCRGPSVLDLGCGDGALLSYLPDDLQKHGIDFSRVAIDRARERHIGHFEVGDIQNLNYDSDTFDTVIMMEVLEHIDDTDGAISEAVRVMKNGARLIITVPDQECITDEKWPGGVSLHVSKWSENKVRSLASRCGLSVAEMRKFGPNLIFALSCCKNSVSVTDNTDRDAKVSFVMIVLNGMPFIEYSLKSIYEFAHEVIIVEGAVEKCMFAANPDGSSTDGTVEFVKSFPDPQRKIKLIQGRWPEKCEMQNEALKHITGDYVWLIDSDEVYKREHLDNIKRILIDDTSITQVNFIPDNFWKGLDHIFVSSRFFEPACHYRRLFKYVRGAVFTSHRPPTMTWPDSQRTTEQMHLLDGHTTRKMGIAPYHYSYVLDEQVRQKIELYRRYGWGKDWNIDLIEWYKECFLKWTPENRHAIEEQYPVWTGDRNSRTQLFTGTHPEVMKAFKGKLPQDEAWPKGQTLHAIGDANSQNKVVQSKRVRVAADYVQAGTQVADESSFGAEIRGLFAKIGPRKIIETGTYLGTGTTTIIAGALEAIGIRDAVFYTIEVNPQNYTRAKEYFAGNKMNVQALNGLSVPRSMLPDRDQIAQRTITDVDYDGIFVDHKEENRVELYYGETNFPQIEDDLLCKCLEKFDFRPDFVLLDSAGHIGSIEFDYLIENLQGECYIALDDIYHVKHHRSFQAIQSDPRFKVVTASKEKFGFCIAHFTPETVVSAQAVRHLLWVRTDSIGDAILASSMLPFVREKFGNPKIAVVCRSHIAELYESCPYVDAVLTFDERRMLSDSAYASGVLENVRSLGVDCTLNAIYSRDIICDYVVAASGARLRIGMSGNLCNISEELWTKHNQWYTHLVPSDGERKPELHRHADFLKDLGCNVDKLTPQIWLSPEDEAYADEWFRRHGLRPQETIALFAGVQSPERIYAEYGKAIAGLCKENGFSVIALGAGSDRELNRRNLKDIENAGVRVCDFSGTLTLRQSAAIIKRCCLAVGAETGLAHIAAAVQTPHVIVIGGGQFGRFMPYSALTSLVCVPLECYGCGWKCKYRNSQVYCITSIQPSVIERAVRDTLATSSDKPRLFVQAPSLWNPHACEPKWKMFDELLDVKSVELISVGRSIESEPSADRAGVRCDVSIVVATKDRGELLDDMLSSLKEAADGIDYEVIIVEGGSCDSARRVLHKHGITQVYAESECLGPGRHSWSQLYNFGFSKARGRWAMYASDDIVFEKGSVAKAVALLRSQKSQSVAGGVFFYKEIIPDYPGWERQGICFALGHKLLMNFGLIRLDVFKELGGFDGAYVFRCPDIDLSFKVYQSGRQLIPLAGCLLTHNNVQDELKHKNLQTADTDYEYLLQKWKSFVPSRLDPPKRLFWDPSYETAFTMPRELEDVNAGLEHFWHGLACLQIGQFHEATRWFSQTLNASCRHWTVFWLVADALHQAGCQAEAQKTADFVLRINPGCEEIQPLLARLKRNSAQSVLPSGRDFNVAPIVVTPRSHFIIEVKHGGIGDHLFYSHLPRIAKQSGKYDKVHVSSRSQFRSEEYRRLIWELNPYVDGFCDEAAEYPLFDSVEEGMNILDKIMLLRGLDDGKRFHEPELYLRCRPRLDLSEAVIYDPNFVSYVGNVSTEAIERFLRENGIRVTHQMKLWEKNFALRGDAMTLQTASLSEFCRVIVSCRQLLCLSSGTATLAAALGKPAIVFYGDGQKKMFHHSRLHKYVNCSGEAASIGREPMPRQIKDLVQA